MIVVFPDHTHLLFLMTANSPYPIELMHSVASCIAGSCLLMSHVRDTLYKC